MNFKDKRMIRIGVVPKSFLFAGWLVVSGSCFAQEKSLVNTSDSPFARLTPVNMTDVSWTDGFWSDRFRVCEQSMVPHMLEMYQDDSISHGYANFEIAAGLKAGEHVGPPFHDGDFYKLLEAMIVVNSVNRDRELENKIDAIISLIAKTQREDGYIHTPVVIEQLHNAGDKKEFAERLDFETYNLGHLMTAACLHYRLTGKKNLLEVAGRATDFLYDFYKRNPGELARNAICPSHYMGVTEMYRTLKDPRYLELARGLIDIRSMVKDGHDHNQDRIPFREQTKAQGHAVRANYLYAGVADVFMETGDESLMNALDTIWHDLVETKLYITGACGALYDGVSPNGTTYDQSAIQQVHQAYGQDYELPNIGAHNESCANIGNLLWNWRMLLATGEVRYADLMEQVMYNSLLAGVSLDGKRYFYTNPLAVNGNLPYGLRWSKDREEYISLCNCCPPNTIRTVAEIHHYLYSMSDEGLWVNFYGSNSLKTRMKDGSGLELEQHTDYPWEGQIRLEIKKAPRNKLAVFLRIPGWARQAAVRVNGEYAEKNPEPGTFFKLVRNWEKGDCIELELPMTVDLIGANPLVETNRNQVAVRRGPVVYCLEEADLPDKAGLFQVALLYGEKLKPVKIEIQGAKLVALEGNGLLLDRNNWKHRLYGLIQDDAPEQIPVRLIPYFAWDNRGAGDMSVWIPLVP
ncbi:MAG: glycoside hydrolase family 127 protein [Mangrovibacterium sp.]